MSLFVLMVRHCCGSFIRCTNGPGGAIITMRTDICPLMHPRGVISLWIFWWPSSSLGRDFRLNGCRLFALFFLSQARNHGVWSACGADLGERLKLSAAFGELAGY